MKKIIILAALLITGCAIKAQPTSGNNQSASHSVTLNLQNSISIIIGFGYNNQANINKSISLQSRVTNSNDSVIVKSNRPWAVTAANSTESDVAYNYNNKNEARNNRMAVVYTATRL